MLAHSDIDTTRTLRAGQRGALLLSFVALVSCAVVGVRCQDDQWHYSGNAQLVTVTSEDLSDLFDSNDTDVESRLPGVLGVHSRKLLNYGNCVLPSSNTPNFISIMAQRMSTLTFNNMNEVGFSFTQQVNFYLVNTGCQAATSKTLCKVPCNQTL